MKRRAPWHDYKSPCIYMITMSKSPLTPALSEISDLRGSSSGISPQVKMTRAGGIVVEALNRIKEFAPQIKIMRNIVMPDHIHFILQVTSSLPKHLGSYIGAFAGNCTSLLRKEYPQIGESKFFEDGFNDRILRKKGQLEILMKYIMDNPRRLLMKRMYPQFFKQACEIEVDGRRFSAFGNLFLLKSSLIAAVRYSSKFPEGEFESRARDWLEIARGGGVLVSPFIHPKEKEVREEALKLGGRIICLKNNGFSEKYKPMGRDFDLCVDGRLLEIAPLEYHTERVDLQRRQALIMNDWAALIASLPPEVKMVIKHGKSTTRS